MAKFLFSYRVPKDYQPSAETGKAWEAWFESLGQLKASLGSTVVEICAADPAAAQRAAAHLRPIAPTDVLDGFTLAVKVPDKGPAVQQVIRLLDAGAIVPESLAIREPTLDDVFLQLTGHRPDNGAGSASQGSAS